MGKSDIAMSDDTRDGHDNFMRKQGPRAQIDRKLYKKHMQAAIFSYPNLDVRAGSVHDLIFDHTKCSSNIAGQTWGRVNGVRLGTSDWRRQGKLSLKLPPSQSLEVSSAARKS